MTALRTETPPAAPGEAGTGDESSTGRARPWWRSPRVQLWGLVALTAVPVLGAIASVVGHTWYPAFDNALELLRIADVGTRHTPVLGPWSRWGWAHPGPLLFWVLAPFHRVGGDTGVLVGTGIVNMVAAGGVVLVGHRRGGLRVAALSAFMVLLLEHGMGVDELIDPWNPWAAFLPFVLFVALAWSVMCRDWKALPLGVVVGSFVVQSHAGYLALVVGLSVVAVAGALLVAPGSRDETPGSGGARRWVVVSLVAGAILWAAPVGQQLFGHDGNLGRILSYVRHSTEPTAGWSAAFGAMGVELRPIGPWITGPKSFLGFEQSASVLVPVLLLAAVVAAAVFAWRGGRRDAARLAVLVVAGAVLAVYSSSRITGIFVPYVLRWWWAVAAFATLSVVWSVTESIRSERAVRVITAVAVAGSVLTAGILIADRPTLLDGNYSVAVGHLAAPTEAALDHDRTYLVTPYETRTWNSVSAGLYYQLERHGLHVFSPYSDLNELQYGHWRLADPSQVDDVLTVVDTSEAVARGFTPPPGARIVAAYDPLSPVERAQANQLEADLRAAAHLTIDDALVLEPSFARNFYRFTEPEIAQLLELRRLQDKGDGFVVYDAPAH